VSHDEFAPAEYKQLQQVTLISGIVHLMGGVVLVLFGFLNCLATYGICCFMPFLGLPGLILGPIEIMAALKLQRGEPVPYLGTTTILGLLVGVFTLNFFAVILETFAMMSLNKPEVKAYLRDLEDERF